MKSVTLLIIFILILKVLKPIIYICQQLIIINKFVKYLHYLDSLFYYRIPEAGHIFKRLI